MQKKKQPKNLRLIHSPSDRSNRKESMTDFRVVVQFADPFTKSCIVYAKKSQGEVTTARELVMRVDSLNQFTWQKCITKRVYFYRKKYLFWKVENASAQCTKRGTQKGWYFSSGF